jgi:hypothetical protein
MHSIYLRGLPVAARYLIQRAVLALGPGFLCNLAEIFRAHGWKAQTGVALNGRCAPHEVDVFAEKNGKRIGIEAKFHNDAAGKTDIKDALYVYARYEDLRSAPEASSRVDEGILITNTRFTRNAIRYAQCSGLSLIGWDYPRSNLLTEARVPLHADAPVGKAPTSRSAYRKRGSPCSKISASNRPRAWRKQQLAYLILFISIVYPMRYQRLSFIVINIYLTGMLSLCAARGPHSHVRARHGLGHTERAKQSAGRAPSV